MIISGGVPTLRLMSKVRQEEDGSQAIGPLGDQANGNTNPRRRIKDRGVQARGAKKITPMGLVLAIRL